MTRKAIAAGTFYPADKGELSGFLRKAFPKKSSVKSGRAYGIVAPHAGFAYSGQCAALAYNEISELDKTCTFVILGTNHTGYAESNFAVSREDFETPLGIARNDTEFCNEIISSGMAGLTIGDMAAHAQEHSIEVQLPFLQSVFGSGFRIVPVICSSQNYDDCTGFAKGIIAAAKKLKRKICIIASGDMTHYGVAYGFLPFVSSIKKNLYTMDSRAIELVCRFKTKKFLDYCSGKTICGASCIAAAIETCRLLGSNKAELINYCTSADISNDYSNAVGYASIAFR
ncbi:MAG: AmmeMemoRadiSam system protein B [archaeon]